MRTGMQKTKKRWTVFAVGVLFLAASSMTDVARCETAKEILEKAFDYYRGESSETEVDMIIHRPDWERKMTLKGWSKGREDALFRVIAPAKDAGNGTLKKDREMWTYNPKVNRVIKIPPSMMSQAWMGSDFSNDDLAKSDTILQDYTHEMMGVASQDNHKVYTIKLMPRPNAPVVWGMQHMKIRDDHILLQQSFFDEDMQLVKAMTTSDIVMLGGKLFPRIWYMRKGEDPDEYTQVIYKEARFDIPITDGFFSISNLKDPRVR